MLSTLLAFLLVWVLYLWFDRQRLLRIVTPSKPASRQTSTPKTTPVQKSPSRPQFPNSKPVSEINRERRRAKQVPPDAPKDPPRRDSQSQRFFDTVTGQSPAPKPESVTPPKTQPEINFDAIHREATRRREEVRKVSTRTQNQLYRLVHGDRAMVERLVKHSRSRHPDRPEQWIWEKTIQDLERDRGYR